MKLSVKQLLNGGLASFFAIAAVVGFVALSPVTAGAADATDLTVQGGVNQTDTGQGVGCITGAEDACDDGSDSLFKKVANILLFIIGAISVIMLIIGGFRYTISQGDSSAVTSAKNTILYSIVGLVVALVAAGLINFVLDQFKNNS